MFLVIFIIDIHVLSTDYMLGILVNIVLFLFKYQKCFYGATSDLCTVYIQMYTLHIS